MPPKKPKAEAAEEEVSHEELKAQLTIAETMLAVAQLEKTKLEASALQREEEETLISAERRRVYHLTGAITDREYESLVQVLGMWAAHSSDPITIVLNSPGGYVHSGLAMYDFLRGLSASGIKVITVGMAQVASMGGVLLQAGDHRILSPHAWMLVHEVSGGAIGKSSELEDEMKVMKRMQDQCLNVLAERSKMRRSEIAKRWKRRDWWMTAKEAVAVGFADEVKAGWGGSA